MSVHTIPFTSDGTASARVMDLPHGGAAITVSGPSGASAATMTHEQAVTLATALLAAVHADQTRTVAIDLDAYRFTSYRNRKEPSA
jgi:hypothetical protein